MQTLIRQASIDDKMAIWDFIKVAYGDRAKVKIPERWNWQFLEHPLIKNEEKLPIFIAIKDNQIVGHLGGVLSDIKIGKDTYRIAAGFDFIVLPVCRGEGVGQKLLQALTEHYNLFYSIACGGATRRIFDRIEHLGYHKFTPIPTYRRFVKLDSESVSHFLMEKTNNRVWLRSLVQFGCRFGADKIISMIFNFLIGIRNFFEWQTKKELCADIEEVNQFDDEIDQLWNATCGRFKIITKRDQHFLNWRFSDHTNLQYRKFIIRRNGVIKGYIVVRKPEPIELNIGIIVDLFAAPDDAETIDNLIRHAITFFDKSVLAIECPISLKAYQTALAKSGFYKFETTEPIFFCMDAQLRTKLEEWENSWSITKAEQDWDQVQPI